MEDMEVQLLVRVHSEITHSEIRSEEMEEVHLGDQVLTGMEEEVLPDVLEEEEELEETQIPIHTDLVLEVEQED